MQVSGKLLLNSAENILKERHKDQRPAGANAGDAAASRTGATEGLNQSTMESRLLKLQANLSTIQHQYSREQARQTYLKESPQQITPELKFGDEPLFPEFQANMNLEGLQKDVSGSMEKLIRSLKSVQVEMENLYALNFDAPPEARTDAAALIEQGGLRNLDPARVAHLTRNTD
ncbi:MAG: hypothetical protein NXI24_21410 [bacterium]|nr:hypothetical protein [bacterium]